MPIYLNEKFGVKRTLVSDDDVFILNDLSYMWDEYEEFGIKKENLFYIRNKDKYDVMDAFNEIFEFLSDWLVNAILVVYLHCSRRDFQKILLKYW